MKAIRKIISLTLAGLIAASAIPAQATPDRDRHRSGNRVENTRGSSNRHSNGNKGKHSRKDHEKGWKKADKKSHSHNKKDDWKKKHDRDKDRYKDYKKNHDKHGKDSWKPKPPKGHKPGKPGNHYGHHNGSAPKPGYRPHHNYKKHNYRPPRPNGGYWGAPHHNKHRWHRPLPPRPPRPKVFVAGIPSIGSVLGLAFGTFIDSGINALLNNGYNVTGYANNIVYINGVNSYGYYWPEAQVYYNDGLCSGAMYQYWNPRADKARFNAIYRSLCKTYGYPVSNGINSYSWWGGNGNGYITLQFGLNSGQYYTNLFIGN